MGEEIEALEAKLDFVSGQVHALTNFIASFTTVSLERDAFVAAIPAVENMLEAAALPTSASEAFLQGVRQTCESMSRIAGRSQE